MVGQVLTGHYSVHFLTGYLLIQREKRPISRIKKVIISYRVSAHPPQRTKEISMNYSTSYHLPSKLVIDIGTGIVYLTL